MIIEHPLLGPRDAAEFTYLGDAAMIDRPDLWFHEQGDRSWLVVTRNTTTHEITKVELARDTALASGRHR
jgi:sarcosine oxidase subunit delta